MNDHDTARERVAEAIRFTTMAPLIQDPEGVWVNEKAQSLIDADAAITAHSAHLWRMADDPEVQEAVARALAGLDDAECFYRDQASAAITATLTALLGPRPTGDTDDQ